MAVKYRFLCLFHKLHTVQEDGCEVSSRRRKGIAFSGISASPIIRPPWEDATLQTSTDKRSPRLSGRHKGCCAGLATPSSASTTTTPRREALRDLQQHQRRLSPRFLQGADLQAAVRRSPELLTGKDEARIPVPRCTRSRTGKHYRLFLWLQRLHTVQEDGCEVSSRRRKGIAFSGISASPIIRPPWEDATLQTSTHKRSPRLSGRHKGCCAGLATPSSASTTTTPRREALRDLQYQQRRLSPRFLQGAELQAAVRRSPEVLTVFRSATPPHSALCDLLRLFDTQAGYAAAAQEASWHSARTPPHCCCGSTAGQPR
ncbi:hypothetical protein HPB50_027864 [Hyalomma asiaticum]|nr:hypothetical protein HPB50_027864 [Hyalomma asiaticum]